MTTQSTAEVRYSDPQNALLKTLIAMAVIVAAIAVAVALDSSSGTGIDRVDEGSAVSAGIGTPAAAYALSSQGAQLSAGIGTPLAAYAAGAVPEHGEFTTMAVRDPNLVIERFVGRDANLDPDIAFGAAVPEHGEFTTLAVRDPNLVIERFAGRDADLDPDFAVGTPAGSDLAIARASEAQRRQAWMAFEMTGIPEGLSLATARPSESAASFSPAGYPWSVSSVAPDTTTATNEVPGHAWSASLLNQDGYEFVAN